MKNDGEISKERKELLIKLESIIGSSCYNGNIQNWGPGGEWEGEGRDFRYPITFVNANGQKIKVRNPASITIKDTMLGTGHYAFGSNELHIMEALQSILDYLESEYGVDFDKSTK
jgi:hypothetical protein